MEESYAIRDDIKYEGRGARFWLTMVLALITSVVLVGGMISLGAVIIYNNDYSQPDRRLEILSIYATAAVAAIIAWASFIAWVTPRLIAYNKDGFDKSGAEFVFTAREGSYEWGLVLKPGESIEDVVMIPTYIDERGKEHQWNLYESRFGEEIAHFGYLNTKLRSKEAEATLDKPKTGVRLDAIYKSGGKYWHLTYTSKRGNKRRRAISYPHDIVSSIDYLSTVKPSGIGWAVSPRDSGKALYGRVIIPSLNISVDLKESYEEGFGRRAAERLYYRVLNILSQCGVDQGKVLKGTIDFSHKEEYLGFYVLRNLDDEVLRSFGKQILKHLFTERNKSLLREHKPLILTSLIFDQLEQTSDKDILSQGLKMLNDFSEYSMRLVRPSVLPLWDEYIKYGLWSEKGVDRYQWLFNHLRHSWQGTLGGLSPKGRRKLLKLNKKEYRYLEYVTIKVVEWANPPSQASHEAHLSLEIVDPKRNGWFEEGNKYTPSEKVLEMLSWHAYSYK